MKRPLSQVDDNLNFFLIYFHVLCLPLLFFFFLFTPTPLFHLSRGESLLSPFSPPLPSHRSSLPRDRAAAAFQHSGIITRPATALVSSLVNHPAAGRGRSNRRRGQRWRCSFSIHPSHLPGNQFTAHQRHSAFDNSGDMKEEGNNFWGEW